MSGAVEEASEMGGGLSCYSRQLGAIRRKIDLCQMGVYTDCHV